MPKYNQVGIQVRCIRIVLLMFLNLMFLPIHLFFLCFAFLLTWVPIFPTRVGIGNLMRQLKVSRLKTHFLLCGVYMNYYFYIYEIYFLSFLGLIVFDGIESCIDSFQMLQKKYEHQGATKGILILGAHYSNFELLGFMISRRLKKAYGMKVFALTKPSRSRLVSAFWRWFRPLMGFHVLETNRRDLFAEMGRQADLGNCISLIADQKPKHGGLFIEFFGTYCAFPMRGLTVLKNARMPVIALASRRIFPGFAKIYFSEMSNAHLKAVSDNAAPFAEIGNCAYRPARVSDSTQDEFDPVACEIMSAFAGWLETIINAGPTQWFWDYKKWSRNAK